MQVGDIVHYKVTDDAIRITGLLRTGEIPTIQRTFLNRVAGCKIAGTTLAAPLGPNTAVAQSAFILFEQVVFRLRSATNPDRYGIMRPSTVEISAFERELAALTAKFNAAMWPRQTPAVSSGYLCSIMAGEAKWQKFVKIHFSDVTIGDKIRAGNVVRCATTVSDFWHGWCVVRNRGRYAIDYLLAPIRHVGLPELATRAKELGIGAITPY